MGAVASFVGDVAGAVFEPIKQIGNIASDVVREVGHAAEAVGKEAGKIGQAALNDPVGTIAKVAAVATQQYWALPLISAATVVANGGDLGQAAIAAGISYAAGAIAAGVGDYLGAGSTGIVDMASADAVELASQGLTAGQIAETLQMSYGMTSEIATQTAAQAALGATAAEIAGDITSQMTTQNLLASAAGNAVGGAGRAIASGGDLDDALMGGLTAGAGTLAGGFSTKELKDLGLNSTVANAIGKATGAAAGTAVAGKDAKLSFINSLINTTLSESGNQVNSGLRSIWNEVNTTAENFNTELDKAKETYETTLTPLEQEARAAQEEAAASYDEYETVKEKFDSIVEQYNAAKDAGDTEKANSLADEANALIPELDSATTAYNEKAATFDERLASYNTAVDEYTQQTSGLDTIKSEYEAKNQELQQATEEFTNTALKVADMGDNAKALFGQLYNTGASLEDAFDTVSGVDELKDPAQEAFLRQYVENNDPAAAMDFANQVNSLDENQLSAYTNAVGTGLDDASAMQLAPNITGMSQYGQNAYLDALRNGADEQSATMAATLAEMFGNQDTEDSMLPDSTDTTDNGDYNGVDYGDETPMPKTTEEPTEETTEGITPQAPTSSATSSNSWLNQLAKLKIPTGGAAATSTRWSLPTVRTAAPATSAAPTTGAAPSIGAPAAQGDFSGIQNLAAGLTKGSNYELTGTPNAQSATSPVPGLTQKMDYTLTGLPSAGQTDSPIPEFSTGGTSTAAYDPFNTGIGNTNSDNTNSVNPKLTPSLTRAQINYILTGMPGASIKSHANGGAIQEHNPQFYSEGGLSSMENRYVQGDGDGTSDSVPAMLANGEFVIPADIVSKIGNGSNEAGAGVLDQFLVEIRKHASSNGTKLPPDSKGPLGYLLDAKRKVKA